MSRFHWKKGPTSLLLAVVLLAASPLAAFAEEEMDSDRPQKEEEALPVVQTIQVSQGPLADLINSVELSPTAPKSQALGAYLDNLMPTVIDDTMDTYQQVQACYDYVIANMSYGSHMSYLGTPLWDGVTCGQVYSSFGEIEGFGAVGLTAGVGMCNAYNSAFILMIREIGLEARLVEGSTKGGGGAYVYHKWTEVDIDGVTYLFDPQVEQSLTRAGMAKNSVFCKTYDQVPGRYIK